MGLIDDQLKAELIFNTNADLMPGVESLTFRKTGGAEFTRNAQVFRFTVTDQDGRIYQRMRIGVVNDADAGIASSAFDEQGWQVRVSYRGETAEWRTLVRPADGSEDHDSGWCWFETR